MNANRYTFPSLILSGFYACLFFFSANSCKNHQWDTAQLVVEQTSPTANASGVSVGEAITATFNKQIDVSTLTISISSGNQQVAGSLSVTNSGLTFTPKSRLIPDSDYTVTIAGSVKDMNGIAMGNSYSWTFHTVPRNTWYTYIGNLDSGSAPFIRQSPDGGFIATALVTADIPSMNGVIANNPYSGQKDIIVVKLNAYGDVSWYTFIGEAGDELSGATLPTADGGFVVSGSSAGDIPNLNGKTPINPYAGGYDMVIVKLNSKGFVSWYTFLGGGGDESGRSIVQTADGGFIVGGRSASGPTTISGISPVNNPNGVDSLIAKLNPTGSLNWFTYLNGMFLLLPNQLAATTDGGCVATGFSPNMYLVPGLPPLNPHGTASTETTVAKLDATGILTWYTFLGGSLLSTFPYAIIQTTQNDFIVTGNLSSSTVMGQSAVSWSLLGNLAALRFAANGSLSWFTGIGHSGWAIAQKADGSFLFGGTPGTTGLTYGTTDTQTANVDTTGYPVWTAIWGGSGNEVIKSLLTISDGSIVFAGTADADNDSLTNRVPLNAYSSGLNMVIVKTNPDGSF